MTDPGKEASSAYTFAELNGDLDELYEILKQENYKTCEIHRMLHPITSKTPIDQSRTDKIIESVCKAIVIILSLIIVIYLLTFWNTFYWNLTAVTRISMIKILPYFDWRPLKNEACLVRRFFDQPDQNTFTQSEDVFNCDLCETLNNFEEVTYDTDHDIEDLIHKFINIDRPMIVKGGIEPWLQETPEDFIEQLINERELSASIPCNLRTDVHNVRQDEIDVGTLIRKSRYFDRFFVQFRNCEVDAVRVFRKYTYRPKVLPVELSPVVYNWLLWNNNRNSTDNFKKIDLVEKYTVIGQIFGKTRLRLIPRKNCKKTCPTIEGVLSKGHFAALTSLWDVEYLPEGGGENIAAVLELKG